MRAILSLFLLLPLHLSGQVSNTQQKPREVTQSDISAVVLAIQDEVYDYGFQKEFWGFETAGPHGPSAQFNIYFKPELTPAKGGLEGVVIYKYLPFGEVIRVFIIAPDGIAYLLGEPTNGFPWTQPNTKTIYMSDDEICRDKQEWRRVLFELDLVPTSARIKEAAERQKHRVGFSQSSKSHGRTPDKTNSRQ